MDEKAIRAQSIVGTSAGRPDNDFYPTPEYVTEALLDKEEFSGDTWEPACGDGSMSRVIESRGLYVYSTDLIYRGYGDGEVDFFKKTVLVDNIITNPPFSLAGQFATHALECARSKVAIFCKLAFLEGQERKRLFESTPLARVHVFSKRVSLYRGGVKMKNSGMIAFAWFVWDKSYRGEPVIRWI